MPAAAVPLPTDSDARPDTPAGVPTGCTGYLAAEGYTDDLIHELGEVVSVHGRLVLAAGPPRPAAWAQNVWFDPVRLPIASIGDAARGLRAMQRNWVAYAFHLHRRSELIAAKLPPVSAKPLLFGAPVPTAPLGSWCLENEHSLLAAPRCSSPFAHGAPTFVENRSDPPNRAYRKLWEAFTVTGCRPLAGQLCLDLGSSPGGWTWVLHELGARVISVDKAPLAPHIAALPRVEYVQASAFSLDPTRFAAVDWLFSDVICYPQRLWAMTEKWRDSGKVRNMLCSIKFQRDTDHETAARFAAVPGATLFHLAQNKHELTWLWHSEPPPA